MGKPRAPTRDELELMRRNGIAPESMTVTLRSDDALMLLNTKTRMEIVIYWENHSGFRLKPNMGSA